MIPGARAGRAGAMADEDEDDVKAISALVAARQ